MFLLKKRDKLIMTIVCQNEIDIIEMMIKFHLSMGVDGIIVTDHRSTDGTRELLYDLKKHGLILEVIEQNEVDHLHSKFTIPMIEMARDKYDAEWIISADADEFYYARSRNLKNELKNIGNINCLKVYSNWYFPEENVDFPKGCLFVKNQLNKDYYLRKNIKYNHATAFYEIFDCPKVIFKAKDFLSIMDGNHEVILKHKHEISPAGITLYHYNTRSYKHFYNKALKASKSIAFNKDPNWSKGWKSFVEMYKNDTLDNFYNERFGEAIKKKLMSIGVVCTDYNVFDFLCYNNIYKNKEECDLKNV